MGVTTTLINKPLNPRAQDASPLAYNRAALYSGKALDFDGVNDVVTTANNLPFTSGSDLSIVSYFKIDNSNEGYFYQNSAIYLAVYRDGSTAVGELSGFVSGSWLDTGYIVNDSKWYQVAQIIDNGTQRIYLNGQEIATQSGVSYDPSSQTVLNIGKRDNHYLNGQIANFKAFNTALTAAQIADLYNNPEKIVPTGVDNTALKLWLPMMEGAGTTAYDGSGNGNHGTISGATYVNGVGAPVSQTAVIDWNKGVNTFEHSEEFDNAYWTLSNTTATANAIASPNGEVNADKIIATATSGSHAVFVSISAVISSGTSYRYSIFTKAGEYTKAAIRIGGSGYLATPMAVINLSNGSIVSQQGFTSVSVTDFNNGWYKISGVYTATSSVAPNIQPIADGFATTTDNYTYTGDGTSGIYVWGASHIPAANSDIYTPTFATAQTSPVLLPQGLTTGRDITGVNLFENVRKQGALNLDGQSWAEVHDNASFDLTNLTLEAWVNIKSGETIKGILGQWSSSQGYMIYLATDSDIRIYINNEYARFDSLTTGWHHIAAVYDDDANKKYIYVDGVERENNAQTTNPTLISTPIEIGRYDESTARQYNGPIAQPRIYNRALTAEEVQRNYNAGKNIYS